MRKMLGIIGLSLALSVPLLGIDLTPQHALASGSCKTSKSCKGGIAIPSYGGKVRVPVFQTHVVLKGQATKSQGGVKIFAQRVVAPNVPKKAVAFRVFSLGHLPRLTIEGKGQLYEYIVANGTWVRVQAITHPGIYAAILN